MLIIIKLINFIESKIEFSKFCSYGTTIFNTLDNTTELWMTKYIVIGEFFSSGGGATLYKNPSDQTVWSFMPTTYIKWKNRMVSNEMMEVWWYIMRPHSITVEFLVQKFL